MSNKIENTGAKGVAEPRRCLYPISPNSRTITVKNVPYDIWSDVRKQAIDAKASLRDYMIFLMDQATAQASEGNNKGNAEITNS